MKYACALDTIFLQREDSSMKTVMLVCASFFGFITNLHAEGDWRTLQAADPPSARARHTMTTLPDGRIIMFG